MCVFCKIVNGEIPSHKIYEDENFIAILDISQASKGHTLIIPKKHYENLFSMSDDLITKIGLLIKKISTVLCKTFNAQGLNVLNNNGSIAGQSVFHFHVHLLPRYDNDQIEMHFPNNVESINNKVLADMKNQIIKNL